MPNWYCTLPLFKQVSGIEWDDTRDDALLAAVLEETSRYLDRATGFHFFVRRETRPFTADDARILRLPAFVRVVTVKTDDGSGTYPTTWAGTDYVPQPSGAPFLSPPWPYDRLVVAGASTQRFPVGVGDGVQLTIDWGFSEVLRNVTTLTDPLAIGAGSFVAMSGVLEVGHTLKIDDEQLFVTAVARGASGDTVSVERAVNGTTEADHLTGATVAIYTYPLIDEACRLQAHRSSRYSKSLGIPASPGGAGAPPFMRGLDPRAEEIIRMFRIPGGLAVR